MVRTLLLPLLAFLAGLGTLKVAIPLESLVLMAAGLALTGFGILRLLLRSDGNALSGRSARAVAVAAPSEQES